MKQRIIDYFKSKRFIRFFILMLVLSIIAQFLQSYIEYKTLVWPLIITLMLGDLLSTFIIYALYKDKTRKINFQVVAKTLKLVFVVKVS